MRITGTLLFGLLAGSLVATPAMAVEASAGPTFAQQGPVAARSAPAAEQAVTTPGIALRQVGSGRKVIVTVTPARAQGWTVEIQRRKQRTWLTRATQRIGEGRKRVGVRLDRGRYRAVIRSSEANAGARSAVLRHRPQVRVRTRVVADDYVYVNMPGDVPFSVRLQRAAPGGWRTFRSRSTTEAGNSTTFDPPAGRYRVLVKPQQGWAYSTSGQVRVRDKRPSGRALNTAAAAAQRPRAYGLGCHGRKVDIC